jgi:2'-deoxynucleoside 5'-phosphate N-hydrolase
MKIYFSGSIRGGRGDQALYLQIIQLLSQYGTVLTEHIGDAKLSSNGQADFTDQYICDRDIAWIEESDIVIAEVTTAGLGVGYEIGKAESLDKKIVCIYREQEGKRLSAMISGNSNLVVKSYEGIDNLSLILKEIFA